MNLGLAKSPMSCCYSCSRCPPLRPSAHTRPARQADLGNLTWLQWQGQLYLLCAPCYQAALITSNLSVLGRSDRAWSPEFFQIAEALARLHRLIEAEVRHAAQAEGRRQGEGEGEGEGAAVAFDPEGGGPPGPPSAGRQARSRTPRAGPRGRGLGRGRPAASRGPARGSR